jgi:hypothetical protein
MVTHSQLASVWLESVRAQILTEIERWDRVTVTCDEPEGFEAFWPEALKQFDHLRDDIPSVLMHLGLEVCERDEQMLQDKLDTILKPLREAAIETYAWGMMEAAHEDRYLAAARYF